ncbi:MAG TPA: hypothetical protein PLG17_02535 [Thermodesulfobacteriota bacterium]|nr:hypothetical protein [Thermodesulfobacteriota bacterium]HQO77371.1 hypothetical protein [Thermodesulfobacteriota bacterium]
MSVKEEWNSIALVVSAEIQARLDERLILLEAVQEVIYHAEASGRKLVNQQTGHFLASFRPTSVTYWVEYSIAQARYVVHNAYCHRMQAEEVSHT